jgi:hypothetical protein
MQQPYQLLYQLGEDELVQIMERPSLAGSPVLARQVCLSFLRALADESGIIRSELLRDVMKRLPRLLPLMAFDALDGTVLASLVNGVFEESMKSLRGSPGNITLATTEASKRNLVTELSPPNMYRRTFNQGIGTAFNSLDYPANIVPLMVLWPYRTLRVFLSEQHKPGNTPSHVVL